MVGTLEMKRISEPARETWNSFFYRGYSPESLGLLRVALGLVLIAFCAHQYKSLLPLKIDGTEFYYIEPMWYFSALGIDHHVPLITILTFGALVAFSLTLSLGLRTRTSIALVLLCILYLKGVRDSISGDVHHRELIPFHIIVLLLLSKSGYVYSLDNLIRKTEGKIEQWEASWPIHAMQLYFCSFYLWSAIAKIRVSGVAWFSEGARLQEILLIRSVRYGLSESGEPAGSALAYQLAHYPSLGLFLSLATMVLEFGLPLLLFIKSARWRLFVLSGVTGFHVANYVLLTVQFLLLPLFFVVFFDLRRSFESGRSLLGVSHGRLVPRGGLVLYDGVCGLCDRAVQFLLAQDRHRILTFAPLQGETARSALGSQEQTSKDFTTIVFIRGHPTAHAATYVKSEAFCEILKEIGGFWRIVSWLRIVPRRVRDLVYDLIAQNRYRWFGKYAECRIPSPEQRSRFLP